MAGIKIDQAIGELRTVWVADDTTNAFQPLIGPKEKRVMLLSNAKHTVDREPVKPALFTGNYTKQTTWRYAATGCTTYGICECSRDGGVGGSLPSWQRAA